jgi:ketosteroid isomerase-like protein
MEQLRSEYGGERPMLRPLFLSLILPALAVPAMAQDAKQDAEKVGGAYQECVNKHDAACVASLYSKDGVQINPGGVFSDIKAVYEQNFKNGEDRIEIKVGHISPLSNDLVLADGETDIFFKNDKGETNKVTVFWTGVDIRENGQLKIRMLTAAPKPEPTKEASADKK